MQTIGSQGVVRGIRRPLLGCSNRRSVQRLAVRAPVRKPGRAQDVRCMVTPFGMPQAETITMFTEVVTTLGITLGALWFGWELLIQQDNVSRSEGGTGKTCPTCNGTGVVPCLCTRWSDGDLGCASCNRTGAMRCKSCGGGGTAVPVPVAIRRQPF